jgi:pyruvate kinase
LVVVALVKDALVSDVVMVARGDLAMEIGFEHVPVQQKRIIMLGKKYNKPVVVATQLLDSMEKSSIPTRAEVSDIAGAVYDGASGLMVSGESAVGMYPVEVIEVMSKVARVVEKSTFELQ